MVKTASIGKYKNGTNIIIIRFPYNNETLNQVRSIPNRKYHSENKCWSCPVNNENVELLKSFGFIFKGELINKLTTNKPIPKIDLTGFNIPLYEYQKEGVIAIERRNGRILIADEMGLGKTVETLAWLYIHPELQPVIIITPASVKYNWMREAQKCLNNPSIQILSGSDTNIEIIGKIIIINYDILHSWVHKLRSINPKVLILDECHYIKNNKAKRTKAVKMLSKNKKHIIALSGTPIVNRPIEIFNTIKLIDPDLMSNYWEFGHHYCNAKHNGYGWDFNGSSNTEELHQRLVNSIMIRRLKKDVLKDLPNKTRSFIPIELDNETEYIKAQSDFIAYIRITKGESIARKAEMAETLTKIEVLKQIAVRGKMKQTIQWIEDFIESGQKLVVFGTHRFVIDELMNHFKNIAVKVDGSVTSLDRQKAVDEFQTNPNILLFIANGQAGGIGLTLTTASNVAIIECPWTPGELEQWINRVHRIGQLEKVTAYFLLAMNTIEEKIAELLDKKRKILDSVLDGKVTKSESLLTELIKSYGEY
jgi:SNF2 family DNA or RNA helicase